MTIRTAALLLVGVVELLVPFDAAVASDWKYAGWVPGKGSGAQGSVAFYDADSVTKEGPVVRYWVKTIARETLDSYPAPSDKKTREFVEAAAQKIATGYVPPLLKAPSLRTKLQNEGTNFADFVVTVVCWELAANHSARMTSRFLWEINCSQKTSRYLEVVLFDEKGNIKAKGTKEEWSFIPPDTNVAWISEVLCSK